MSFCRSCNQPIGWYSYDSTIKCNGPCQCEFHSSCTNLNNQAVQISKMDKNIVWKCDNCFYLRTERFNSEKFEINAKILYEMEKRIQILEHKMFVYTMIGDLKNGEKPNSSSTPAETSYIFNFHRRAVIITGAVILLTILTGIAIVTVNALTKQTIRKSKLLGDGDDSRKHIPINSTIADDNVGGGKILRIVPRDAWLAQPPSSDPLPLVTPVKKVIVLPTRTDDCETQAMCVYRVRMTQTLNIESQNHDDIIYNFLIGGDGNVYEGRGWDAIGAHLRGFNSDSISFAYIGTFKKQKPSEKQMDVTKLLLAEGVRLGKLSQDYKIYGAYMLDPTSTDVQSDELYNSFKGWPHWSEYVAQ